MVNVFYCISIVDYVKIKAVEIPTQLNLSYLQVALSIISKWLLLFTVLCSHAVISSRKLSIDNLL